MQPPANDSLKRMAGQSVEQTMHSRYLLCVWLLALIVTPAGAQDQSKDFLKLPQQQAERELPSSHPANFLVYASRRFQEGAKEDAVLWFYVGEIRYRFYL